MSRSYPDRPYVGVGIVVLAYVTVLGGNIDYQILNF